MTTTLRMQASSQVDAIHGQHGNEAARQGRRGDERGCVFIHIATVFSWRNLYPCR